jgi:hypothetical protein
VKYSLFIKGAAAMKIIFAILENFLRDMRYALRQLCRAPKFPVRFMFHVDTLSSIQTTLKLLKRPAKAGGFDPPKR